MGYGCGHLKYDEDIHLARWGARLIYSEVAAGGSGVVWDRQSFDGPEQIGEQQLTPVINEALEQFRLPENRYTLHDGQSGHLVWRRGPVVVVMSPQGSYGYLYITAVCEKPDFEGKTEIWEFSDVPDRVELGNWPPRIVEARESAAQKSAAAALEWKEREWKWAIMAVHGAKPGRTTTIRQKKADALGEEVLELRRKAGVA